MSDHIYPYSKIPNEDKKQWAERLTNESTDFLYNILAYYEAVKCGASAMMIDLICCELADRAQITIEEIE